MLEAEDDLLHIEQSVHWANQAPAIGAEAAKENGSAVLFEEVPGKTRLMSGVYGGPDQMLPRNRTPWSRLAMGVGLDNDIPYDQFAHWLTKTPTNNSLPDTESLKAKSVDVDLYSLGLPTLSDEAPTITLGLCAVTIDEKTEWAPIHACVESHDSLIASIPAALEKQLPHGTDVTIALGVPTACLIAAKLSWMGETKTGNTLEMARAYSDIAFADEHGDLIPASAEGVISGTVGEITDHQLRPREGWEKAIETTTLKIRVTDLALREKAILPFSPLGAPLADDIHLASIVESVRLLRRLNNYWGVSPVEWIHLPAETHLGMCLVATEILYAGFEWQLANTLFAFSRLFDKVLILDEDTPPGNLARAFDDMWIKAHPSHDWEFSEPQAPAATATAYRSDGTTGSRLFIDATWDPRWDDEFIAPRVDFESSYPEDIRAFVLDTWDEMGFSTDPGGQ
ncbi:UbiD family decarboxylase [Haladaptatus pallidirubidus]